MFHDEIAQAAGLHQGARDAGEDLARIPGCAYIRNRGTDRALQEELGVAYKKVGDIQGSTIAANLGDTAGAMRSYANAVALLEPLHESEPTNGRIGTILAKTYFQQTSRTIYVNGPEAALPIIRKAVVLSEALQSVLMDDFERMGLLGNAYSGEAEVLTMLGRMPEARASLEKMVSACEDYARAHPKDQRGLMSLGAAYGNSAVLGSRGLAPADAYARSAILLQKGMAADEALLALKPDNAAYQLSLAETRLNVADLYYGHGDYARAIELNRQAAAVFAKRDLRDSRTQLNSAINDIALAKSLARSGGFAEAETLFVAAEKSLRDVSARGADLQADYSLADLDIRRGEMYLELARRNEARPMLERGLSGVKKVQAAMPDDENVQRLLADGTQALARATRP